MLGVQSSSLPGIAKQYGKLLVFFSLPRPFVAERTIGSTLVQVATQEA